MLEIAFKIIIFLFPLAYSPGPGSMFFAANGARFGFYKTIIPNFGYHTAAWIITVLIGLGFGKVINVIPHFLEIVRYAGAFYIFYLSWVLFHANNNYSKDSLRPASFFDGVILLLLNPKSYLIITVLYSNFLSKDQSNDYSLILFIATIFTINNLGAFSMWSFIGDGLMRFFNINRNASIINKLFSTILVIVAFWILFS